MNHIKLIESSDIRKVLKPTKLIPAIEKSLSAFSHGPEHPSGAVQPIRSSVEVTNHNGTLMVMPGFLPSENALATKVVSLYPNNVHLGVPTHSAVVILMDATNGRIISFLDGDSITELRTAASSAVASKYLAGDHVSKIAILGSGIQGAAHARIHHHLYKPKIINIWSRNKDNAKMLVKELTDEGICTTVSSTVEEAVREADIINTCTLSTEPILFAKDLKDGVHINAIGAPRADWRELDSNIMQNSVVYVDSKQAALKESGDVILSKASIYGEIGEVINGDKEAFRNKTTVYKSLGIAVLDAAAARLAYDLLNI